MEQITRSTPQQIVINLAPACDCLQCRHGCTMGSGIFAQGEVEKLAKFLNKDVEDLKKNRLEEVTRFGKVFHRPKIDSKGLPYGKCTFFDEKIGCAIHEAKPLQCKVAMGCKEYGEDLMLWFMLNHVVDPLNQNSVREYAAYLKSGAKVLKGGELESLIPDREMREKTLNFNP